MRNPKRQPTPTLAALADGRLPQKEKEIMADEEDWSRLSLDDRVTHKSWKARVSAYEELQKSFSMATDDVPMKPWIEVMKKSVKESNLVVLESALGALLEFCRQGSATFVNRFRSLVLSAVIEKCLGSNRLVTRQRAVEILLEFIDADSPAPVVEELVTFTKHKQPKLVLACVALLKDIVRLYGAKTVDVKPLIKIIPVLFGHADQNVRAETNYLSLEIYKWTGQPVFDGILKNLKPVQAQELSDLFSSNSERASQTRYLRTQKPEEVKAVVAQADGVEEVAADVVDEPVAVNLRDLADPVDVLSKVPKNFDEAMASSKWKDRKEALDELFKVLDTPKYADGHYHSLVSTLGKKVADVNILVAIVAVSCIEKVAKGLDKAFSSYRSAVFGPLLEKLKEKKAAMNSALRDALDAVANCSPLKDILEDVLATASNKNPQVRVEGALFLVRCLENSKSGPAKPEAKAIADAMRKILDDSAPEVREAAMQCLGILMIKSGEKVVLPFLDKVDALKIAKIREFQGQGGPNRSASNPTLSTTRPSTSSRRDEKENNEPSVSDPFSRLKKKPVSTSTPNLSIKKKAPLTKSSSSVNVKSSSAVLHDNALKSLYTDDQALDVASELFGDDTMAKLDDSAWKVRLEGVDLILASVQEKSSASHSDPISSELAVRILKQKNVWKDANFQVISRIFAIIAHFCRSDIASQSQITKPTAEVAVPLMVDKLGDMKLRRPAYDGLIGIMENCGLGFTLKQSYDTIKSQKAPKSIAECLKCIKDFILEFGIDGVDMRELIEFLKVSISNSNALVRSASVSVFGVLRQFIGPDISNLLSDVNPAQLSTIEVEFEKVANSPAPKPNRVQKVTASTASLAVAGKTSTAASSVEDLFPRVDITSKISVEISANISSSAWKERKEGLDAVQEVIRQSNKRLKPTLGELASVLPARLNDSNKNIVVQTLDIVGSLAEAIGNPFERHVKLFSSGVVANLNDNKANIRQSALACLSALLGVVSLGSLLPCFETALAADMPNLRKDLLSWLSETSSTYPQKYQSENLLVLAAPLAACLKDRSLEVRKSAQQFLAVLVEKSGYDAVKQSFTEFKVDATVMSQLETLRDTSGSQESVSSIASEASLAKHASTASLDSARNSTSKLTLKKKSSAKLGSTSSVAPPPEPVAAIFPVTTSSLKLKEKRADQDRGMYKWTFDAPRKELVEFLREQMEPNFSSGIVDLLFSNNHYKEKDFVSALSSLEESMDKPVELPREEANARFIANSDLIFRYITLRLFDTNTTNMLKCLDVVEKLVNILDESSYQMSDYEGSAFLPFFLMKIGDSKEAIRLRIKAVVKQFCRIYPASKVFTNLVNSLTSKNSRTRTECLDEIGSLIQRNGLAVCNPAKSFPLIAAQISDRDSSVRNAAIQAVLQAYLLIDEQIFKYVGRLSDKDRAMLDEKIKRNKASSPVKKAVPSGSVPDSHHTLNDSNGSLVEVNNVAPSGEVEESFQRTEHVATSSLSKKFSLGFDELKLPELSRSSTSVALPSTIIPSSLVGATPSINRIRSDFQMPSTSSSQDDYAMDFVLTQITSGDVYQSIDALKQLEKQLQTDITPILSQMNPLVNAVTLQIRLAFVTPSIMGNDSMTLLRLLKHLINVLVQMFSKSELAEKLSKDTMHQMLTELITRLVDKSLPDMGESGVQLIRAFNVLMLKVLENCPKNHVFSVLLDLLDAGIASINHAPANDDSGFRTKFTELVMKCLWKLTKSLRETVRAGDVELAGLFYDIHRFLTTNPSSEWKRRASEGLPLGDMPLRTVKTILHEIASEKGVEVLSIMEQVNIEEPKRSAVYQYLKHMSDGMEQSSKSASPAKLATVAPNQDSARGVAVAKSLTHDEISYAIEQIFTKISSKDETKQGLNELYTFQKQYSESNEAIEAKLGTYGINFRLYISRSLEKIAAEMGDSSDNMTISTPSRKSIDRSQGGHQTAIAASNEADDYKERLLKLQKKFESSGGASDSTKTPQKSELPSYGSAENPSTSAASNLPSVVALKERLERMKSSMAALPQ